MVSFNPSKDIPDLKGKTILVTGGMISCIHNEVDSSNVCQGMLELGQPS